MIEPFGREELLAMLLARKPEGVLDMVAAASPEDAAELVRLRESLVDLALVAEPVVPRPGLRERVLAHGLCRPRRPVLVVLDMINDHLTPGRPMEVPRARDDRRSHSPDLVMWEEAAPGEPVPLPVAVEVELTLKSVADLAVNVRAWAGCEYIEAVLYYVETRKVENRLLDAIEQCKAEEMIVVNPLSAILKPQPGFPLDDQ